MNYFELIHDVAKAGGYGEDLTIPVYVEIWERDENGAVTNKTCMVVDRVRMVDDVALIVEPQHVAIAKSEKEFSND